jgi:flavin reductase (DIM6/NTAB) family NADH-FMN oxidoreductase RutF
MPISGEQAMAESFSSAAFREALAHFASGVTIVTAHGDSGPIGFTASAFASVSLAPPLVLVCVKKASSTHDAVVAAGNFGINVLADRQTWIADQFARTGVDRFAGVPLRANEGEVAPLVEGALVQIECRRHATHEAGDHTILLGEVIRASVLTGRPLVHYARRYGAFAVESAPFASAPANGASKGGIV